MIDIRDRIGTIDVLMVTLDTLRHDVAVGALRDGLTPRLSNYLPGGEWEERHTLGAFTYAAHHAFLSGFLPVPVAPGIHPRLFAAEFPGSETMTEKTFTFKEATLVEALRNRGYHTACVGGVGFFNKKSALGSVLPGLFAESHWTPELGVTDPRSTENQVRLAKSIVDRLPKSQRVFLFVNVSALHQPNRVYLPGAKQDSPATQAAALSYVDQHLPSLFAHMSSRAPTLCIVCSDHGTAYGEDGYAGHRHQY